MPDPQHSHPTRTQVQALGSMDPAVRPKGWRAIAARLQSWWTARTDSAEDAFAALFDGTPHGIVAQREGIVLRANAAAAELYGYENPEAMVGVDLRGHCANEATVRQFNERIAAVKSLQSGQRLEPLVYDLVDRQGQLLHVRIGASVAMWRGALTYFSHCTDVTESLREQAQLQAIMANAPGCILVTQGNRVRRASLRLAELVGQDDLEPVGLHVSELWRDARLFEEIRRESTAQLHSRGRVDLVRPLPRPDGSVIQLRFQGSPLPMDTAEGPHRHMVWILSDLTAEMSAFRAREAAEAASRAKTDFLATMSHELRTPLNGVLGLAELARSRDTKAAERKEYLHQLADCAHSLADILNDILDLSKIEAGRMEIEPRAMDLSEFVERLKATYTSLAEARGLELRCHLDPEVPRMVLADPTRLRQIAANFLGNALKFTAEGHIRLALSSPQAGRLLLEVEDTGAGIADELLPRLFSPFEQARHTLRDRPAGTGLGLAICRQLARLMGGEVGVSSRAGKGSRFWMDIPIRRPDAQALAQAVSVQRATDMNLAGLRVLLAEDNEINALITMRALTSAGAAAHRVADGRAAIDAVEAAFAKGEPYSVVLMDVQMPVMDGLQATRELRMRACGEGLRIIALTAGALAEQREECRDAGMDAHLLKPLHRDRLLQEVLMQARQSRSGSSLDDQANLAF